MEFKTVTDLDKWFRDNVFHIQDLFERQRISQQVYNYHIRKLIKRHESYRAKLGGH